MSLMGAFYWPSLFRSPAHLGSFTWSALCSLLILVWVKLGGQFARAPNASNRPKPEGGPKRPHAAFSVCIVRVCALACSIRRFHCHFTSGCR